MTTLKVKGNASGSGSVTITPPNTGSNRTLTLPDADVNQLSDATLTTQGDVLYRDGSGIQRLAKGTAGQVLKMNSAATAPEWGAGIVQVVSTHKTDVFTTAATSPTDVTGLSAAITPSSTSNKVLIIVSIGIISNTSAGQAAELYLLRGSTQISIGGTAGSRTRVSGAWAGDQTWEHGAFVITFLDSPSTTSATTYKLQMCTQASGTACLNQRGDDTDAASHGRGASSITVMEVAA